MLSAATNLCLTSRSPRLGGICYVTMRCTVLPHLGRTCNRTKASLPSLTDSMGVRDPPAESAGVLSLPSTLAYRDRIELKSLDTNTYARYARPCLWLWVGLGGHPLNSA